MTFGPAGGRSGGYGCASDRPAGFHFTCTVQTLLSRIPRSNAMRLPLGDHDGYSTWPLDDVKCVSCRLTRVRRETSQMFWMPSRCAANAMCSPSGDHEFAALGPVA